MAVHHLAIASGDRSGEGGGGVAHGVPKGLKGEWQENTRSLRWIDARRRQDFRCLGEQDRRKVARHDRSRVVETAISLDFEGSHPQIPRQLCGDRDRGRVARDRGGAQR